jgi:hypothetical protein
MHNQKTDDAFRALMAAVVTRALEDLKGNAPIRISPADRDRAMAFINSPDGESICLVLNVDYATVREQAVALYRKFLEYDVPLPAYLLEALESPGNAHGMFSYHP